MYDSGFFWSNLLLYYTLDNEILQSKKRTIGPPSSLYVYIRLHVC